MKNPKSLYAAGLIFLSVASFSACSSTRHAPDRVISSCENAAAAEGEAQAECKAPARATSSSPDKNKRPYSYQGGGAKGARN